MAEGRGTSLVVATNAYHAFRAAIIARELGLDAQVMGAPTARYYFPPRCCASSSACCPAPRSSTARSQCSSS